MNYQNRIDQLKGELMIFKAVNSKPNFAALGREYDMELPLKRTEKDLLSTFLFQRRQTCKRTRGT